MKNVVIIHYNTPELTEATIKSLNKFTPGCKVYLLDNSDQRPFTAEFDNVEIIDNTKGQIVSWDEWVDSFKERQESPGNNYGSAKHCYSIDLMTDIVGDSFVHMDSDILLKQDISDFWDERCAFVGQVHSNVKRRAGVNVYRVIPFLCYINVPMMRQAGFRYFDKDHMWDLQNYLPNSRYDTGAWFYHKCMEHGLPYRLANIAVYMIHLGHGSWAGKDTLAWIDKFRYLYT